jgi:hypothetical protein
MVPFESNPRVRLVAALEDLIATYSTRHQAFSAWESHCLAAAIAAMRFGEYERALQCLSDIQSPPAGAPTFPLPRALTLDEVQQVIVLIAGNAPRTG